MRHSVIKINSNGSTQRMFFMYWKKEIPALKCLVSLQKQDPEGVYILKSEQKADAIARTIN